jgi:hypothetical protein
MQIELLGGCLVVDIFFEDTDAEFDDNICLRITEPCSPDECLFKAGETNIYLTPAEARRVAHTLLKIAEESDLHSEDGQAIDPDLMDILDSEDKPA